MKRNLLVALCLLATLQLYAQKFEVSLQASTNLFRYAGKSATSNSFILQGPGNIGNYSNNPYGSNNGASYGAGIQSQFVTKPGFILGLQAGYEILKSKLNIDAVYPYYQAAAFINTSPGGLIATGNTYLQNKMINLNPYIGYRWQHKKVKVDIMPGMDIGLNINTYDKGKAVTISDGTVYQTNNKRSNIPNDLRLRIGLAGYYNKFGLTASYASGLTNYQKGLIGGGPYEATSKLFRFGVSYRIY